MSLNNLILWNPVEILQKHSFFFYGAAHKDNLLCIRSIGMPISLLHSFKLYPPFNNSNSGVGPPRQYHVAVWYLSSASTRPLPPSPRPTANPSDAEALQKPTNHHWECSKPGRADWQPKIFHVHKQVVQRKAEKNTPRINHLFMLRSS